MYCHIAGIGKLINWFLVSTHNSKLKEQKSLKLIQPETDILCTYVCNIYASIDFFATEQYVIAGPSGCTV